MNSLSDPLLRILNVAVVVVIYLFLFRIVRAIWAEVKQRETVPVEETPAPAKDGVKRGAAKSLRIVEPANLRGRSFQLTNELTIGRAAGCQVSLEDTYASQLHARVFRQDSQAYVEDLGSTNGTFLNRRKVTAPTPLHNGDRVQIGRTVFEVRK